MKLLAAVSLASAFAGYCLALARFKIKTRALTAFSQAEAQAKADALKAAAKL